MEPLHFFKTHKPKTFQKQHNTKPSPSTMITNNKEADFEDGDDSFFELELTTTPLNNTPKTPSTPSQFVPIKGTNSDPIPKRKVFPIEPIWKPSSPISLLKSAPKLSALTFRKSRSTVERQGDSLNFEEKTKLEKYLKVLRSFYVIKKVKFFSGEVSVLGSPLTVDSRKRKDVHRERRWLGRSRSKSAAEAAGIVSPAAVGRRDDSLALHYDGIQSAILYCKDSFNSSKDCSYVSRYPHENLCTPSPEQ